MVEHAGLFWKGKNFLLSLFGFINKVLKLRFKYFSKIISLRQQLLILKARNFLFDNFHYFICSIVYMKYFKDS